MAIVNTSKEHGGPEPSALRSLFKSAVKALFPRSWIHAVLRLKQTPMGQQSSSGENISQPKTTPPALIRTFDFIWLVTSLKQESNCPPCFYSKLPNVKPSLCYLQTNTKRICEVLADVVARYGLTASVVVDKKMRPMNTFEDLMYTIAKNKVSEVKLTRGSHHLNFRMEAWVIDENSAVGPRGNVLTRKLYLTPNSGGREFLNRRGANLAELFDRPHTTTFSDPIDVVYTWVNGSDPAWQSLYRENVVTSHPTDENEIDEGELTTSSASVTVESQSDEPPPCSDDIFGSAEIFDRYASRDELKYSIRSIAEFMPWIRNMVIVSNCKPPEWLDTDNPRVRWVDHSEILDAEQLPTFNSHAIESALHKIPDLSEHFIYFNDDLFIMKPLDALEFFTSNGLARIRLESYGNVHGEVDVDDEDYLNAARNVQKLLEERFGKTATQLHTHTPAPMRVSVLEQAEADFFENYECTRRNKLRHISDISPTSFLSPHYHFLSGNAVSRNHDYKLVKQSADYNELFERFVKGLRSANASIPSLICINDGGGSTSDDTWNMAVKSFMEAAFPWACEFEK